MSVGDSVNAIMQKSQYLREYLKNAPYWVVESLAVVKKKKDMVIVEENAKADTVYILVEGTVSGIDYRIK